MTSTKDRAERRSTAATCGCRNIRSTIVVNDGYAALSVASVTRVVKFVNDALRRPVIQLKYLVLGGDSAVSSCGLTVKSGISKDEIFSFGRIDEGTDVIFFCLGQTDQANVNQSAARIIRESLRRRIPIYSLGEEKKLILDLAAVNTCAWHWRKARVAAELYPDTDVQETLFETVNGITTCAGESAALDTALAFVLREFGKDIAEEVCRDLLLRRPRRGSSQQPQQHSFASGPISLCNAVQVMLNNPEDPLRIREIAKAAGVSQRQIERLFMTYLGVTPARYYKKLRLEHAHQLLEDTELPLAEIAAATGFSSTSHLSRSYIAWSGNRPSDARVF